MSTTDDHYQPQDTVAESLRATLITGTAGLTLSAVQNTLAKQNATAMGIFTRSGSTIAFFAVAGGAFTFSKLVAANLRETNDMYNTSIGGFLAGSIFGLRYARLPIVLGLGASLSVLLSAMEYTGGSLKGNKRDPKVDEYERKEQLRKDRRRPIQETINELGEGRGIHGPGYAERRRERIKANYGIDVGASEDR